MSNEADGESGSVEFVEPIKSIEQIEGMKNHLKQSSLRDWLMFTIGINSGLRISDLLRLTVEDVDGMDRINIKESKTGKSKSFPLSAKCKLAINEYLGTPGIARSGILFSSRKSNVSGGAKAISRQQAYQVLNDAAVAVGIITPTNGIKIGTHSLRKIFGYHAYNNGTPIETIMKLLNHSSPSTTLSYIGITKQTLDDVYIGLDL